jgi:hypothetical protein
MLAKGRTAIDGLSGSGNDEPRTEAVVPEVSILIWYASIGWVIFLTCERDDTSRRY